MTEEIRRPKTYQGIDKFIYTKNGGEEEPLSFDGDGNATLRLTAKEFEMVKAAVRDYMLNPPDDTTTLEEVAAIFFEEGELNG
jgi:hypothetical protein